VSVVVSDSWALAKGWTAESGILVFNIIDGQIAKKARLEILLDDGYWPVFTTEKARSTQAHWDQVGEGFIKVC
jgi:Ca2+-dependent lipid-binding protein